MGLEDPGVHGGEPGCEDDMGEGTDMRQFVTIVQHTVQKGLDLRIPRAERRRHTSGFVGQ